MPGLKLSAVGRDVGNVAIQQPVALWPAVYGVYAHTVEL